MKKTLILLALLHIAIFAQTPFTDPRDNKTYKTAKIGEQVWMAENLNYNANGSWCYDGETENCQRYGRMYNWETANAVCPNGWHLPTNAEWDKLIRFVDGTNGTESPYYSKTAGKDLKATSGWEKTNGTDKHGFTALPGGKCVYDYSGYSSPGEFGCGTKGFEGYWWSASKDTISHSRYYLDMKFAYDRTIYKTSRTGEIDELALYGSSPTLNLLSVRCLRD